MSTWLDTAHSTPRAAAVADGFGVVFNMMLAAVDSADLDLLRRYDEQWAGTLPHAAPGRFDGELLRGAVVSGAEGPGETLSDETHGSLRALRAVYRFGLLAWILETAEREGGSPERHRAGQMLAAHFRDTAVLTYVAGKAITAAQDSRIVWWPRMLEPRERDRVVRMSFVPDLIVAYLSVLMDLLPPGSDRLDVPAEPWLEPYHSMLGMESTALGRSTRSQRSGREAEAPIRLSMMSEWVSSAGDWL